MPESLTKTTTFKFQWRTNWSNMIGLSDLRIKTNSVKVHPASLSHLLFKGKILRKIHLKIFRYVALLIEIIFKYLILEFHFNPENWSIQWPPFSCFTKLIGFFKCSATTLRSMQWWNPRVESQLRSVATSSSGTSRSPRPPSSRRTSSGFTSSRRDVRKSLGRGMCSPPSTQVRIAKPRKGTRVIMLLWWGREHVVVMRAFA